MHQNQMNATPKPISAVRLSLNEIPKSLKQLNRWILWRYTLLPNKKWTKVPHGVGHGRKIDATDFTNGATFTDAVQALRKQKDKFDGLGFLLGDGIAGIDVDDCIDDNGNMNERGARISEQYAATYAEVSPSGRGFKLLVDIGDDAKLAVIGRNTKEMEIYGGNRYFTVTGAKLPNHADVITPMAEAFASTAAQLGVAIPAAAPVADMPLDHAKQVLGIDMKAARELYDHLPFRWCDEYGDWLRGGMALHHEFNGSMEALAFWDEYSQRSDKYDPGICAAKWQTFGRPGKDPVTMRTIVRDAQATGWRAPHVIESAVADFTPFNEPVVEIDDDGVLSEPPTWWHKYSVREMMLTQAPVKKWVWRGLLRQGKVLVLAGSGGASKSYLMLAATMQYALGNSWGPFEANQENTGRVLLIYGEEDHDDVHDRLQILKHTFMVSDDQIDILTERMAVLPLRGTKVELARQQAGTNDVIMTDQMAKLEKKISEYQVKLVVLDPMALLHSLEENDNQAISAFMAGLDSVCLRTGCSIVLVHHFGKAGALSAREVNESNVRGASALAAHARGVVVMHRLRADEATKWGVSEEDYSRWVMFKIVKNNYGPVGEPVWFNVNKLNGAITPSPVQLIFQTGGLAITVSPEQQAEREARRIATAEAEERLKEQTRARQAIAAQLLKRRQMVAVLLAQESSHAPSTQRKSLDDMANAGLPKSRTTWEEMRFGAVGSNEQGDEVVNDILLDTDGLMTARGHEFLNDNRSLLDDSEI